MRSIRQVMRNTKVSDEEYKAVMRSVRQVMRNLS